MNRTSEHILNEWLVLLAQGGNERAMETLLGQWYPKLIRYASYQVNDIDVAQDIVQDTCLAVSKKINALRDPASFPKWVYKILQRRCIDYIRSQTRIKRTVSALLDDESQQENEDMLEGIGVREALRKLSADSYQVIHLHYLDGFDLNEIASIIDIPVGTVKSRLHSARNQLRHFYQG